MQGWRGLHDDTELSTLPILVGPAYCLVPVGFLALTVLMLVDLPRVRRAPVAAVHARGAFRHPEQGADRGKISMIVALPMLVLLLCLLAGVPIAVALAGSGMFGIWLITGDLAKVMNIVGLVPFSSVADYQLTTIPMFILMAYFSASSGLARDLYAAAAAWLSHIRGGLAIATVFACGIFGAMSGASTAAASVMSRIAMPEMRRHGYSEELARGLDRRRRDARHSHPAEHRHGDLRHRDADLDRQAPGRRRHPRHHRRRAARRHDLYLGADQPAARARDLPHADGGAPRQPDAGLAEPSADRAGADHALHRHRHADRDRRARRVARRRDRRAVRPADLCPRRSTR